MSGRSSLDCSDNYYIWLRRCTGCRQLFCFECDLYIHESLHVCPGCEVAPQPHDDADDPGDDGGGGAVAMDQG